VLCASGCFLGSDLVYSSWVSDVSYFTIAH